MQTNGRQYNSKRFKRAADSLCIEILDAKRPCTPKTRFFKRKLKIADERMAEERALKSQKMYSTISIGSSGNTVNCKG